MILISEIFGPTVQGEGALIGVPTVFVRTGGCDFRCSWCDTLYAVEPQFKSQWQAMTAGQIMQRVNELSGGVPLLVTLSGGNPALQPLAPLLELGHAQGYRFALETQGSRAQEWFAGLDYLTLSPKPPSSGMRFSADRLRECIAAAGADTQLQLKLVVADEADYLWAREVAREFAHLPLCLQPCNLEAATPEQPELEADLVQLNSQYRWLVERVAADRWFAARVLPQLHVLVWNNERGV